MTAVNTNTNVLEASRYAPVATLVLGRHSTGEEVIMGKRSGLV
ncbi:hypothetical protein EYZ11_006050 [Aspergillus tanneri]|uniref:Uncharacterized protein n=1 Tax=Aspergillus tanneri TaxID=1220188 RepID=A0A4S3JH18_9EURO|nr:hypothetical protein EYZ11_006050 [Aspergillus tanneri]